MMKKLSNMLKEEHNGVVAIEATILMPLMFTTMVCLLYMLFMVLTYITYSNIASNIAHQMNMRQTGYEEAFARYGNDGLPTVFSFMVSSHDATVDGVYNQNVYATNDDGGKFLRIQDINFGPNETPLLRAGLFFALDVTGRQSTGHNALDGVGDQFIIPFVRVDGINVDASKKLIYNPNTDRGNRVFANTVITVGIRCNCINPFGLFNWFNNNRLGGNPNNGRFSSLISFEATGYDVIA